MDIRVFVFAMDRGQILLAKCAMINHCIKIFVLP